MYADAGWERNQLTAKIPEWPRNAGNLNVNAVAANNSPERFFDASTFSLHLPFYCILGGQPGQMSTVALCVFLVRAG